MKKVQDQARGILLACIFTALLLVGCSPPVSENKQSYSNESSAEVLPYETEEQEDTSTAFAILDGCVSVTVPQSWELMNYPTGEPTSTNESLTLYDTDSGMWIPYEEEVPAAILSILIVDIVDDGEATVKERGELLERMISSEVESIALEWDNRDGISGYYLSMFGWSDEGEADENALAELGYTSYLRTSSGKDIVVRCFLTVSKSYYDENKSTLRGILDSTKMHHEYTGALPNST